MLFEHIIASLRGSRDDDVYSFHYRLHDFPIRIDSRQTANRARVGPTHILLLLFPRHGTAHTHSACEYSKIYILMVL